MSRTDLHADMLNAMIDVVLKRVEGRIKAMCCDTSATAPEHVIGHQYGYRQAKQRMLDLLEDAVNNTDEG